MKMEGDEIDPQGLVNSMMESWRTDFMKAKKLNYTNRSSFEMADKMIRSWQNVGISGKDFIIDYRSTVGSFDNGCSPFNKTQSKTWLQILLENEDKLIKPVEAIPLLLSTMKFLKKQHNWNCFYEEKERAEYIESLMLYVALPDHPYDSDERRLVQQIKKKFDYVHYVEKLDNLALIVFKNYKGVQIAREALQNKQEVWETSGKPIYLRNSRYYRNSPLLSNGRKIPYELMIANIYVYGDELQVVENELRQKFPKMSAFEYHRKWRRIYMKFENLADTKDAFELGQWFKINGAKEVALLRSRRFYRNDDHNSRNEGHSKDQRGYVKRNRSPSYNDQPYFHKPSKFPRRKF